MMYLYVSNCYVCSAITYRDIFKLLNVYCIIIAILYNIFL